MPISKEQIIDAAETLQAAGVNPTQINVREKLGGGSFSTIQPVLAEWNRQRLERVAALAPTPDVVLGRAKALAEEAWRSALSAAESILGSEREALRAATALIEVERGDISALADELESRLSSMRIDAESLNDQVRVQANEIAILNQPLHTLEGSLGQAERQLEVERHERQNAHSALMEATAEVACLKERLATKAHG